MTTAADQSKILKGTEPPGNKIAIIGMSCLFPGAADLASYWMNIIAAADCIGEVPLSQWQSERFYDPQSDHFQNIYCKRGGFLDTLADFDPLKYGVMPSTVDGADPYQFLALRVALDAMRDAGYIDREFDRDRAEVLLGRTSAPGIGSLNLIQHGQTVQQVLDILAVQNPELGAEQLDDIARQLRHSLSPCNADTIPGVMPNVLAGRIANRLGLRGKNMILDGACASSLLAVDMAVADLSSGQCDLALAGGVHVNSNPFFYQMFCRLGALSRSQQIRPFDEHADGTILGEGIGIVVLKRLEDAVKDGDRIYAVIIGTGTSSDGRDTGLLAPSVEGEALAMRRAYEMAAISPTTIGLLEAHGTGTPAGDLAELQAISKVFGTALEPWCAIGSVKSMIGHAQAASGVAGLIKATLALYHKVLPPTLNVQRPTPAVNWRGLPCYVNSELRPWLHPTAELSGQPPRRAATSAFGFGGVNAHVVLEEYESGDNAPALSLQHKWDSELLALSAASVPELVENISQLIEFAAMAPDLCLKDLAYTISCRRSGTGDVRLVIIASSVADLLQKLQLAAEHIAPGAGLTPINGDGIFYSANAGASRGKLAYLLPGLGAAYPNMLKELCLHFPEVRQVFDFVDDLALAAGETVPPSKRIFPASRYEGSSEISAAILASADSAVVTLLMAEYAIYALLNQLKIEPDALMGCSTGEFAAITMSGAVDIMKVAPLFYNLTTKLARSVPRDQLIKLCSIKVDGSYERLRPALEAISEPVYVAADMTPKHFIVSGERKAIDELGAVLKERQVEYHRLPVAIPYHTPLVQGVIRLEQDEVQQLPISAPALQSWSCSTMQQYPDDTEVIRRITTDLFTKPIRFRETIEAMYQQGIRTFVEIGPKGGLTSLVEEILKGREFLALACDVPNRPAIYHLQTVLASLWTAGVNMQFDCLFLRRGASIFDLKPATAESFKHPSKKLALGYPELKLSRAVLSPSLSDSHDLPAEEHSLPAADSLQHADQQDATVLEGYLQTLAQFHAQVSQSQEAIMLAYLQSASGSEAAHTELTEGVGLFPEAGIADYAFLHDAVIEKREGVVHLYRTLDLSNDRFLIDHAIGGIVSNRAGHSLRVYLLPLMVALEMMAEAASIVCPNLPVRAIRQVRAFKRIEVGEAGFPLRLEVHQITNHEAQVKIFRAPAQEEQPLVSCQVEFGVQPVAPAEAVPISLSSKRSAKISASQLYEPGYMFHGPSMQSVVSIDAVDQKGISGRVQVRTAGDWFAAQRHPRFLIDPLLLDNASQLVLFHLFEHTHSVAALLPFYIESIEFQQQLSGLSGVATVQANLLSVTDKGTEAWLQIVDRDGRVAATVDGINSRRIVLPLMWQAFVNNPAGQCVSRSLDERLSALGDSRQWHLAAMKGEDLPGDDGVLDWLADYILSGAEREIWLSNSRNDKRRRDWLLGRIAAKDAVRSLIEKQSEIKLCPADIEIIQHGDERPVVVGGWIEALGWIPEVSIAHSQDVAVAVAGLQGLSPGIDLEAVVQRDGDFESLAFQESERLLLERVSEADRARAVTQMWCTKEALGKAFGMGLSTCLTGTQIADADWIAGRFIVRLNQPQNQAKYVVTCSLFDDLILALTACSQVASSVA